MNIEAETAKQASAEEKALMELLKRLYVAVKHMQTAQSKLIAVLRPTHDRRLVSDAAQYSDASAEELQAVREELAAAGGGAT
jgi:hypothetical protein